MTRYVCAWCEQVLSNPMVCGSFTPRGCFWARRVNALPCKGPARKRDLEKLQQERRKKDEQGTEHSRIG